MGDTFGVPMSCDTDCMRAVDSRESTRLPDGATPPARWVRAKWGKTPRREGERAAGEPGKDPLLHGVERLVGHCLLELAVYDTDVDTQLIRAVRARVGREIAGRGRL